MFIVGINFKSVDFQFCKQVVVLQHIQTRTITEKLINISQSIEHANAFYNNIIKSKLFVNFKN